MPLEIHIKIKNSTAAEDALVAADFTSFITTLRSRTGHLIDVGGTVIGGVRPLADESDLTKIKRGFGDIL